MRSLIEGVLQRGVCGLGDQAVVSATNFASMVVIARGLGPAAFGAFSLVFAALLFANNIQAALFTQPHNVLGATLKGKEYRRYTTSAALGQLGFAAGGALLAVASGVLMHLAGLAGPELLFAAAPATLAWQVQEFTRRVLYTEERLGAALVNDLVSYLGQALLLLAAAASGWLTAAAALLIMAVTSALAAALGVWQIGRSLCRPVDRDALAANWHFGRWLGASEMAYWASAQGYTYLAAATLGPFAAGVLRASTTIFGPLRIISLALYSLLPAWFARSVAANGRSALRDQMGVAYTVTLPAAGLYCLAAALLAGPLLRLLYGDAYAGYGTVLVLYAVFGFLSYLAQPVRAALAARRQTRSIFLGNVYGCLSTLILGWPAIQTFGPEGAVVGLIVTEVVINGYFWQAYLANRAGTPAAAPMIRGSG